MKGVYYVAHSGEVEPDKYVCGICGFTRTELGECPQCKLQIERTAKGLKQRQQREDLFKQIDEFVEGKWDDADGAQDSD